ncbi:MAG: DNA-binding protein [Rhodanobacteraceae bacterium]
MPRGITQEQVNVTADALLQAGERPTVERVRAHLGTGSPNTITRMLDTWRLGLAERLREVSQLPGLPDAVGQAMTSTWTIALQHAREHAQQEIQAERDALQQSRSALEAREAEQAALIASAQDQAQQSADTARQATAQAQALQRLVQRLETEVQERAQQCERLTAQVQAAAATETALRDRIQTMEAQATQERSKREEHVQTVEDRAHTQVGQARTDLKTAHAELADTRKRYQKEIQLLQRELAEFTRSLGTAEREAAHQRGVAEALKLKLSGSVGAKPPGRRRRSKRPSSPRRAKSISDAHPRQGKRENRPEKRNPERGSWS